VSINLKKTIVVCAAALTGCELVAGIHDLTYSPTVSGDDGPSGGPEEASTGPEASGGDAPVRPTEGGGESSVAPPDGSDTGTQNDAGDAPFSDAPGDGVAPPADAPVDADASTRETGGDGSQVESGSDAEAGTVISTVQIPGPDGGAVRGADGGALTGDLIDDVDTEVDPGWILARGGRVGTWFTYDDGTAGGVVPAPMSTPAMSVGTLLSWDGRAGNLAIHVTGNGAASSAGTGFNLNAFNGPPATYDASAYQGFVFWGRIGGTTGTASVKFQVTDRNTAPAGGVCTAASDGGTGGCYDYFSRNLTFTPTWQEFVVYYGQPCAAPAASCLAQAGFGLPRGLPGLDAAHIYSCQFQLAAGAAFDIWVDDVYFISR
jgi:hypothetical protein